MIGTGNKGWIGVDIGTHTVKLAQVERRGGRVQLSEALVVRRREPWQDAGIAAPPVADSGEEMRAGISLGSGFAGRKAAVALTMTLCDVRSLNVPEEPVDQWRESIRRELDTASGWGNEAREFDFWPIDLGTEKSPNPENVIAASISQEWAHQVTKDLSAAKLTGEVLDILPLSLARAIELAAPGSSKAPVAAVDWGYRRATFCVVLNGRPVFVRCLRDASFSTVLAALCQSLSISNEEAQKLLTERGLPAPSTGNVDDLQEVIGEVASQPLQVFAEELERTMTYLRQQRRGLTPQRIVLFGGGAAIRNIGPHLSAKMETDVAPWTLDGNQNSVGRNHLPLPLLGSAVALSALAWEKA